MELQPETPVTEQKTPIQTLWEQDIDLTEEEYTEFSILTSRFRGTMRYSGILALALLLCGAGELLIFFVMWLSEHEFDLLCLVTGIVFCLIGVAVRLALPARIRRRAHRDYQNTLKSGYSYRGILRVREDRVEKETEAFHTSFPLDGKTGFIESENLMVFLRQGGNAILLPARCTTAETARAARDAAGKLNPANRKFSGRFQPRGEAPTLPPAGVDPDLCTLPVRFEPDEIGAMVRAAAVHRYVRQLPLSGLICFLCGFTFGWDGTAIWPCVVYFLLCFALLTAISLGLPLLQTRRMEDKVDPATLCYTVRLTRRGIWIIDARPAVTPVPWCAITHVYDRDDSVEILGGDGFRFRLPKRCITDWDAFKATVDDRMAHKNDNNE